LASCPEELLVQFDQSLVVLHSLAQAYQVGSLTLLAKATHFAGPLNQELDGLQIEVMSSHLHSHTGCIAQVPGSIVLDRVATEVVADVESNAPYLPMSQSVVVGADQLTYVKSNTYLEDRGSYLNRNLGRKNRLGRMEECCCRTSAILILEVLYLSVELGKEFLVRLTRMRSCKTNANYRSKSTTTQGIQESQPGVTMYRMSMPVAAVAKAVKAAFHSHTAVVEGRDD